MRPIDGDALYKKVAECEELARKRALGTEPTLSYSTSVNPAYTQYFGQLSELTNLKHMIADAQTIESERKTGTCDECIHKYRFDYEPPCQKCIRIASKGRVGDYFCKDGEKRNFTNDDYPERREE